MNQKGFSRLFIVAGVILAIILIAGAYYHKSQNSTKPTIKQSSDRSAPTIANVNQISPTPFPTQNNPLNTAKNPNWENLNWIIVFTNSGEPLPENIKSDLCNGSGVNKLSYLPTWFKREANKYGVALSMSVKCYDKQVALPQNVISTTDTYSAFGKAIPLPLDMQKTRDYFVQTLPELLSYDLITVVHYMGQGASVANQAGVGNKLSYVFIAKSNLIDGVQYYAPNVTEPNLDADPGFVKGIVHEALHSLRAKDHYDYNNFNCSDEPDKKSRSFSIMCAANFNSFTDYIVSPQTAKEVGWMN